MMLMFVFLRLCIKIQRTIFSFTFCPAMFLFIFYLYILCMCVYLSGVAWCRVSPCEKQPLASCVTLYSTVNQPAVSGVTLYSTVNQPVISGVLHCSTSNQPILVLPVQSADSLSDVCRCQRHQDRTSFQNPTPANLYSELRSCVKREVGLGSHSLARLFFPSPK